LELKTLIVKIIDEQSVKCQSKVFKALSNPLRLKIIKLLTVREMCLREIMDTFSLTRSKALHHLKVLEEEGFVRSRRKGNHVFFELTNKIFMYGI